MSLSTAAIAAIAALFQPLPASAAPGAPGAPAVPDSGSRPVPQGALVMPGATSPGQQTPGQQQIPGLGTVPGSTGLPGSTLPGATTTSPATNISLPGVPASPIVQAVEKKQNEIRVLGDQLIKLGQDRDLAKQQTATADKKVADLRTALLTAQQDAKTAVSTAMREQAALPPGTIGSGLADLDSLARMQRGDTSTKEAADRQLEIIQAALSAALSEQATATTSTGDLSRKFDKLNADIAKKQKALDKYKADNADAISASTAAQGAADNRLGGQYLDGTDAGRGADPRAIAALKIALNQIGDPYVWSEEGPDEFDCSGLMYYAYRSAAAGNYPLQRVAVDQYHQTSNNLVDRYSLVPGDLLFFSSSSSWTDIHHVAMYAGKGKMVEAPTPGEDVTLSDVRWSRLFGATRVYGSVDHKTTAPDLDNLGSTKSPTKTPNPGPAPTKTTKPPTGTPTTTKTKPPTLPTPTSTKTTTKPPTTLPTPDPTEASSSPAGDGDSASPSDSISQSTSADAASSSSESSQSAEG